MGLRGRKSPNAGGYGHVTAKGYRRVTVWIGGRRRQKMEHVLVWERVNGPIPKGYELHHKNDNKLDNRVENLELVDDLTHKRIHSGCEMRDGEWWKPCCKCKEMQPVSTCYYTRKDGISPWCKRCCIRNAVENKRRRRSASHTSNY